MGQRVAGNERPESFSFEFQTLGRHNHRSHTHFPEVFCNHEILQDGTDLVCCKAFQESLDDDHKMGWALTGDLKAVYLRRRLSFDFYLPIREFGLEIRRNSLQLFLMTHDELLFCFLLFTFGSWCPAAGHGSWLLLRDPLSHIAP